MARIRSIKPDHGINKKIGKLSDRAYRVWVGGLLTQADDEGKMIIDYEDIKVRVFAYYTRVNATLIKDAIKEIVSRKLLYTREIDGIIYGQLHDWQDHQKISHPSKSNIPDLRNIPEHSGTFRSVQESDAVIDRIGKDRIGKDRIGVDERVQTERFNAVWAKYPNKDGKKDAERHFLATVKTEDDWNNINKAIENYLKTDKVKRGFIKNGSTWFNNWKDFIDYKDTGGQNGNNNKNYNKIVGEAGYKPGKYAHLSPMPKAETVQSVS